MKQKEAEALWVSLRSALVNAEAAIVEIIKTRAWEPLGYDTFAQAWNDRMRGVKLAAACNTHIVYALLDEARPLPPKATPVPVRVENMPRRVPVTAQYTPAPKVVPQPTPAPQISRPAPKPLPQKVAEKVAATVGTVTPEQVQFLDRQRQNGVPPHMASTRVRSHDRVLPRPNFILSLELTASEIENYKLLCSAKNLDMKSEALKAVRAHFAKLEQGYGK